MSLVLEIKLSYLILIREYIRFAFKTLDEFMTILTTMQVVTDYANNFFQIFRTQFASDHCTL